MLGSELGMPLRNKPMGLARVLAILGLLETSVGYSDLCCREVLGVTAFCRFGTRLPCCHREDLLGSTFIAF